MSSNLDPSTVDGFGRQWSVFDQRELPPEERNRLFERYFAIFPWKDLPDGAAGMDVGCGSGRWAAAVAPRVANLYCVDASPAVASVARRSLERQKNCRVLCASADSLPVADGSLDFLYSLGVLHHMPDTAAAISACAKKLRAGAPMLLYLYYALDNRPWWYRAVWRSSDAVRRLISRLPFVLKRILAEMIAVAVYLPAARFARSAERRGRGVEGWPLSSYRNLSLYSMRTDALDRFGTRLERRFSKSQIASMMASAGLERIEFRDDVPFWCAVGRRSAAR